MRLKSITEKMLELLEESTGVSIDSRSIGEGEIFFALQGENVDGNKYASAALERGALAAIVDDEAYCLDERYTLVPDVLKCLQDSAKAHRNRFEIALIAITGTNGKTTSKELLNSVLSRRFNVLCTEGNLNNHIGVPLTLMRMRKEHEMAIIEMGASGKGEIETLCHIADPDVGIVTNIGRAHIEGFGSEEIIAKTKSELYDHLLAKGADIFLPVDVKKHPFFAVNKYVGPNVHIIDREEKVNDWKLELDNRLEVVQFSMQHEKLGSYEVQTHLFGDYNFLNILHVFSIATYCGVTVKQFIEGVENYKPSNNRSQITEDEYDNRIILDAYNANPTSMYAALDHFVKVESERVKIAILGDMLEMGEESLTSHREVIKTMKRNRKVLSVFVGKEFFNASKKEASDNMDKLFFFQSNIECKKWWKSKAFKNALILVKGSRGIALEKIFE